MEEARRGHIGQVLRSMLNSSELFSICEGRQRSRGVFASRVLALSQGLRKLGLKNGDRVAIAALSSDYYLEWLLAVPCAGGIVAPLNYRWGLEEATAAVQLVQPALLIVDEHCISWGANLKCGSIHTRIFVGHAGRGDGDLLYAECIIRSNENAVMELRWAPNGIALICFTSGTTSTPKGVVISHNALIVQSLAKLAVVGYSRKDIYLHTAPLCHIGGLSSAFAMHMAGGIHVVLPKFRAAGVLDAVDAYKISSMIAVPAMLRELVQVREGRTFPSVSTVLNGGGGIPFVVRNSVMDMFPSTVLLSAYGMTEACSSMTFRQIFPSRLMNNDQVDDKGECVGRPAPHVEMRVTKEGRVQTRGPHVMEGYWRQANETEAVLSPDGWLDTGDIGRLDSSGALWLLGRAKDVIKTGGENVHASEVEMVLAMHPAIDSAAVVGIPDARLSEAVAGVVVLNQGWTWKLGRQERCVSESILRSHCSNSGLSRYKIPKLIVHRVDPLPVTSTGKIRKNVLKSSILSSSSSRL